MKKLMITMMLGIVFLGTQVTSAQEQTTVDLEYQTVLLTLIAELQAQINERLGGGAISSLGGSNLCGFTYSGSESIFDIQRALQEQGYTITKVDGKIGPETRSAVSAFQAANGAQKVDGLIGDETRSLLMKHSISCVDDISGSTIVAPAENNLCRFDYTGDPAITAVQQELKNQGYTITKVDGKIGPETQSAVSAFQAANGAQKVDGLIGDETRIVLSRSSVSCGLLDTNLNIQVTTIPITGTNPASSNETTIVAPEEPVSSDELVVETSIAIIPTEITAAARSTTAGIPDDTAVFTYVLEFNLTNAIYISTAAQNAFKIDVYADSGIINTNSGISSVVSSAQKVIRDDGVSYFRVENGDTLSLRLSIQPGAGNYYGTLGRLTYTENDARTVANPRMENYTFSSDVISESVVLLN